MNVPLELDGAKVLFHTNNKESNDFGCVLYLEDNRKEIVKAFAIARYDGNDRYYQFGCDINWNVICDTLHDSVEEAKSAALGYRSFKAINWE